MLTRFIVMLIIIPTVSGLECYFEFPGWLHMTEIPCDPSITHPACMKGNPSSGLERGCCPSSDCLGGPNKCSSKEIPFVCCCTTDYCNAAGYIKLSSWMLAAVLSITIIMCTRKE